MSHPNLPAKQRTHALRSVIAARVRLAGGAIMLTGACASLAQHGSPAIKLATLEWPPYTGQNLPGGGTSTSVVKAAFSAVGQTFQAGFYPWTRAMSMNHAQGYAGYYPEYASPRTRKECLLAGPIGSGRLGFAVKSTTPLKWDTVRDLHPYRVGVVRNYINSQALDEAIASGNQAADEARDDAQNLRKLIAGRIDLAVIDAAVFEHLMKTDGNLRPHLGHLVFAERALETKELFVCFRRDAAGRSAYDLFNTGLRKIGLSRALP